MYVVYVKYEIIFYFSIKFPLKLQNELLATKLYLCQIKALKKHKRNQLWKMA